MNSLLVVLLLLARFSAAIRWGSDKEDDSVAQRTEDGKHCELSELSELLRGSSSPSFPHRRVLQRRQSDGSVDGSVCFLIDFFF